MVTVTNEEGASFSHENYLKTTKIALTTNNDKNITTDTV
jgi:hypothetical protein